MDKKEKKLFTPFLNGYSLFENIVIYFNDYADYMSSLEFSYSVKKDFPLCFLEINNILGEHHLIQKNDVLIGDNKYKTYLTIVHRTTRGFYKYNKKDFTDFGNKIKEVFNLLNKFNLKPIYIDYERLKFIRSCFLANNFSMENVQKSFKIFNTHLEINGVCTKVVTISQVDKKEAKGLIKNSFDFKFLLNSEEFKNIDLFIYNQSVRIDSQSKKKSKYKGQLNKYSDNVNEGVILKSERLQELIDSSENITDCFFSFTIKGKKENIDKLLNFIQSYFNDFGVRINLESFNQLEIFSRTFPGTTIDVPKENLIELDINNATKLIFN